ncbi:MAG: NAD(P)H-binding protein [Steroidobacteraceae bacterium]
MLSGPNRTVLVAGASGVIGRRLCRLLVDDGWNVIGMTRSEEKAQSLAAMGVKPMVVDVFDAGKLRAAVVDAKPTIIVHMLTDLPPALAPAAMAAARVRNAHIRDIGTRNLIAAAVAAGTQRMVAQSVCFAYAPGPTPYPEDRALNAGSIAGSDGVIARGIIALERQVMGAPFTGVVLRFGRFYGPETGLDAPSAGGAVHVDAAADAARRAVSRGKAGAYNIAEENSTVVTQKAKFDLDWRPAFRIG